MRWILLLAILPACTMPVEIHRYDSNHVRTVGPYRGYHVELLPDGSVIIDTKDTGPSMLEQAGGFIANMAEKAVGQVDYKAGDDVGDDIIIDLGSD